MCQIPSEFITNVNCDEIFSLDVLTALHVTIIQIILMMDHVYIQYNTITVMDHV